MRSTPPLLAYILTIGSLFYFSPSMHGQGGYTLDFDGVDEYVEAAYDANLNPANITLEAWVKVEGGAGNYRSVITSRQINNTGGYMIYVGDDNQWQFWTGNNSNSGWNSQNSGIAASSEWTHIACSYDGTNKSIYINGVLAISTVESYAPNTTRPLRIGAGTTEALPNYYFPGKIDEVRIWSDVRTQAEIQANMHKELTGSETNLVGYYQMSDGSSTTLTDNSANSNDGTLTNGPAWKTSGALAGSGMALSFDGVDDEVNSTITMTPTDTFTLEAWINFESLTGKQSPLDFQQPGSGAQITVNKENVTNRLTISIDDGASATTMYTTAVIAVNQWYHLAIVYIENQVLLYVNGAQIMNGSTVLSYRTTASNDFYIGAANGTSHSNIKIDEIRIWDDIRSQSEILSGMFRSLEGDESNLVAYYRFDQQPTAGNTTLYDYSDNGQDGTLSSMDATTDWVSSTPFNTWIGSESSDWSDGDNWSSGSTPTMGDVGIYGWAGSNSPATGDIIARNVYINSDASVSLSGNLSISGNFFNSGTFSSSGSLSFSGSSTQYVAGLPATFGGLTVDNGAGVILTCDLTVSNTLSFSSGVITLNGNTLTLGNSATVSGTPDATTHVNATSGTLSKGYSGAGSFSFPVGDGSNYTPISLDFTSGTFSSAYTDISLSTSKHPNNPSTSHFLNRYWTVNGSGISDFSCDVIATYVVGDINGTESELYGGKWSDGWIPLDPVNTSVKQITGTVTGFSDFSAGEATIFPVEWLSFEAESASKGVDLSWATASESNSHYFGVERSRDLGTWTEIGQVDAAGFTTEESQYLFTDLFPTSGENFYRLRQVDFDGRMDYSEVRSVWMNESLKLYPNPVRETLNLDLPAGDWHATMFDQQGREVRSISQVGSTIDMEKMPAGVYYLILENGQGQRMSERVIRR